MYTNLLNHIDYDQTNTVVDINVQQRVQQYSIMVEQDFVLPQSMHATNIKDLMHTFTGWFYSFKNSEIDQDFVTKIKLKYDLDTIYAFVQNYLFQQKGLILGYRAPPDALFLKKCVLHIDPTNIYSLWQLKQTAQEKEQFKTGIQKIKRQLEVFIEKQQLNDSRQQKIVWIQEQVREFVEIYQQGIQRLKPLDQLEHKSKYEIFCLQRAQQIQTPQNDYYNWFYQQFVPQTVMFVYMQVWKQAAADVKTRMIQQWQNVIFDINLKQEIFFQEVNFLKIYEQYGVDGVQQALVFMRGCKQTTVQASQLNQIEKNEAYWIQEMYLQLRQESTTYFQKVISLKHPDIKEEKLKNNVDQIFESQKNNVTTMVFYWAAFNYICLCNTVQKILEKRSSLRVEMIGYLKNEDIEKNIYTIDDFQDNDSAQSVYSHESKGFESFELVFEKKQEVKQTIARQTIVQEEQSQAVENRFSVFEQKKITITKSVDKRKKNDNSVTEKVKRIAIKKPIIKKG